MDKRTMTKRRNFIKAAALGATGLAYTQFTGLAPIIRSAQAQPQRELFARHFKIPPLETGRRTDNEVHFDLKLNAGTSSFFQGVSTNTLGINGDYLGPVLRAKQGDHLKFSVTNQLNETATLHWHGMMLPAKMDGGPHQEIQPGETWTPEFDLIQPASTYWYHSHTHRLTGRQVYHGLAGLFIVDDDHSLNLNLPNEYGVDDIPVIIQDRAFNNDGSFRYATSMHDRMRGMLGNKILVNGVVTPTLAAEKSLLRLRLLNGSNARIYDLSFADGRPFTVIAGDGGFIEQAQKVQGIRLAPGERAEILLDLSNGQDAILRNLPTRNGSGGGMGMMMGGGDEHFNIMRITAPAGSQHARVAIPKQLISLADWREKSPAQIRKFELEMAMGPQMMMSRMMGKSAFSINGAAMDMDVINFRVKNNSFEIWEISNNSMLAHPFHIHNTQFRLLARSGQEIAAAESGLKDTVLVYPQQSVRLIVPFPDYSDAQTPYMYHCHILEHEDGGMMGQFTVEA